MKRLKLFQGFSVFFMILFILSCQKDIDKENIELREYSGNSLLNSNAIFTGDYSGCGNGEFPYNVRQNQAQQNYIHEVRDRVIANGQIDFDAEFYQDYGAIHWDAGLAFGDDSNNPNFVNVPIFNQVKGKVTAFIQIVQESNDFAVQFVDRYITEYNQTYRPTKISAVNTNMFNLFDYSFCLTYNYSNVDVPNEDPDVAETDLCTEYFQIHTYFWVDCCCAFTDRNDIGTRSCNQWYPDDIITVAVTYPCSSTGGGGDGGNGYTGVGGNGGNNGGNGGNNGGSNEAYIKISYNFVKSKLRNRGAKARLDEILNNDVCKRKIIGIKSFLQINGTSSNAIKAAECYLNGISYTHHPSAPDECTSSVKSMNALLQQMNDIENLDDNFYEWTTNVLGQGFSDDMCDLIASASTEDINIYMDAINAFLGEFEYSSSNVIIGYDIDGTPIYNEGDDAALTPEQIAKINAVKKFVSLIMSYPDLQFDFEEVLWLLNNTSLLIEFKALLDKFPLFLNEINDLNLDNSLDNLDFLFDDEFWSNPDNLNFQNQNLPSWQAFYDAFPKNSDGSWMYGADNIYPLVGGDVLQARLDYPKLTNNTCALKVSIALVGSGIQIPYIEGSTVKGADDNYYFLNAKSLNIWMQKTFGVSPDNPKQHSFSTFDVSGTLGEILNYKKGIYIAIFPEGNSASGHADLFDGNSCTGGCHLESADTIHFWELE